MTAGKQNDLGLPDFALLLDGLQAEREQGITIDVAYRYFATDKRSFIVADTPGHEQYTRNMATGASTADLADPARRCPRAGLLEQTRRHATIASLMGIKQFVLAVNKIDLTGYDKAVLRPDQPEFKALALSLGVRQVTAIPMSALKGENVVYPAGASMPWYEGSDAGRNAGTCHRALVADRRLPPARAARLAPGRKLPRLSGHCRRWRGEAGRQRRDPAVRAWWRTSTKIVTFDLVRNAAVAGDAITLVLDRQVDVARGDMIVSLDSPAADRASPSMRRSRRAAAGWHRSPASATG